MISGSRHAAIPESSGKNILAFVLGRFLMRNVLDMEGAVRALHYSRCLLQTVKEDLVNTMICFGRTIACGRVLEIDLRGLPRSSFYGSLLVAVQNILRSTTPIYPSIPTSQNIPSSSDPNSCRLTRRYTRRGERKKRALLAALDPCGGSIIWDRRFFVTSFDTPGLALSRAAGGDSPCILLSCVHHIALRWVNNH